MADLAMAAIDAFNYCRRFRIFGCVLVSGFRILEQNLGRSGGLGTSCTVVEASDAHFGFGVIASAAARELWRRTILPPRMTTPGFFLSHSSLSIRICHVISLLN